MHVLPIDCRHSGALNKHPMRSCGHYVVLDQLNDDVMEAAPKSHPQTPPKTTVARGRHATPDRSKIVFQKINELVIEATNATRVKSCDLVGGSVCCIKSGADDHGDMDVIPSDWRRRARQWADDIRSRDSDNRQLRDDSSEASPAPRGYCHATIPAEVKNAGDRESVTKPTPTSHRKYYHAATPADVDGSEDGPPMDHRAPRLKLHVKAQKHQGQQRSRLPKRSTLSMSGVNDNTTPSSEFTPLHFLEVTVNLHKHLIAIQPHWSLDGALTAVWHMVPASVQALHFTYAFVGEDQYAGEWDAEIWARVLAEAKVVARRIPSFRVQMVFLPV